MIGQAVFLVASDMARELGSPTMVLVIWIIGGIIVLFGASVTQNSAQRCQRRGATMFTSAEDSVLCGVFCMAGRVQ